MFKHISKLLNNFIPKKDEWKIKLFNNWDKVIGNLKNKVTIIKIEHKLLVLGVSNPALAQELFILSDILKNKINSLFEKEQIKYIRFKIFKKKNIVLNKFKKKDTSLNNKNLYKYKHLFLTKTEYKNLTKIKDYELKENLKKFYLRCKKDNK